MTAPGWIRFQAPELPPTDQILERWAASRDAQWFSNGGPCVTELADRLAAYVTGDVHAVPVSSGTAGLLAALRAVVPASTRGAVLVPSYTFAATAACIEWAGLTPVYVDVDPRSWHADPASVTQALERHGDRVVAALLCATYGSPPSAATVAAWEQSCRDAGIPLVVDSAAGFGSRDADGSTLGRTGDAEVFSLHATKPFAVGEGGVVVTGSADLADRMRRLGNFGFNDARVVDGEIGLNFKMDELHGAIALCALDQLDAVVAARQQHVATLRASLEPHGFVFQEGSARSAHQFLPMLCESQSHRDRLLKAGPEQQVELKAYFQDPLHTMPAFAQPDVADLPVTDDLASRVVCLPVHNHMSEEVLARIADVCATG